MKTYATNEIIDEVYTTLRNNRNQANKMAADYANGIWTKEIRMGSVHEGVNLKSLLVEGIQME